MLCALMAWIPDTSSGDEATDKVVAKDKLVADTIEQWNRTLAEQFRRGDNIQKAEAYFSKVCRDKASLVIGGSGASTRYYLIDDVIQIVVELDAQSRMTLHPVAERRGTWLRKPTKYGGLLLAPHMIRASDE